MRIITYMEAFLEGVKEEMENNPDIFWIGTDLRVRGGHWGQVKGIADIFGPERVIDSPISEAAMLGLSYGAAITGLKPICDLNFEDFILGGMDELVNQIAKARHLYNGQVSVPLVIRASTGSARSAGPQHSQSFESWYAHTPGLLVVVPSNGEDVKGLIKSALRGSDPVLFLTHKMLSNTRSYVREDDYSIPLGVARIARAGNDVTVVAYSIAVNHALLAAEELESMGISVEVIDLRSIVPLDLEAIELSVKKTQHLVIAHEAYRLCGVGAEIAAHIGEKMFDYLDAPIKRIGSKHAPISFSPVLQESIIPNKKDIVQAVSSMKGV